MGYVNSNVECEINLREEQPTFFGIQHDLSSTSENVDESKALSSSPQMWSISGVLNKSLSFS